MIAVPCVLPDTMPVLVPTEATVLSLLLHVPPADVLANVVVAPTQTVGVPVTGAGIGYTVTTAVAIQPVAIVNVILDVPAAMPVTTPEDELTVAVATSLLLQVPAPEALDRAVVVDWHTDRLPVMGDGGLSTVTVVVATQSEPSW